MVVTPSGPVTVLDGDTVQLGDGQRVRLPGIDCPEAGRPRAEQATRFTAEFLARGRLALCPADPPRDHYGRLLADLEVEGESLSLALVSRGFAWVYATRDAELLDAQAEAVRAGRGAHDRLDRVHPLPLLVSGTRFHRGDCPWVARDARRHPLCGDVRALLAEGRAPCRTCLPWPP